MRVLDQIRSRNIKERLCSGRNLIEMVNPKVLKVFERVRKKTPDDSQNKGKKGEECAGRSKRK